MFKKEMMRHWCDAEGKPDPDKMAHFMDRHNRASMLDTIGWSLFFIWVGIAWIAGLGFGIGLLGVAAITLGEQLARKFFGLAFEGFWLIVGSLFALGGIWELLEIETSLAPVIMIVVGVALLGSLIWRWTTRSSGPGG